MRRRADRRTDAGEPDERVGRRVGPRSRYRLIELIGEGAMGEVYAAHDSELDRTVAVKCVHPRHSDPENRDRLLAEARTLARLAHPNVVPVFDITTEGGEVFVAMEFVDGQDLRAWVRSERPGWRRIISVLLQAGEGLAHAHAKDVVHRDFKPTNVLIGEGDRARVVDFGLARSLSQSQLSKDYESSSGRGAPGSGTPRYMAPEVRAGEAADERSDQYSFCISAWELLFGRRPAGAADARAVAVARNSVPRRVRTTLIQGLADDPTKRFASMNDALDALRRAPNVARRRTAVGLGGLIVLVGGGLWVRGQGDPCLNAASVTGDAWNETKQEEVRAAFEATASPNAQQAAARVIRRIDGYVTGWAEQRLEACRATHVEQTQSPKALELRVDCLEDRIDSVNALVDTMAVNPDIGVVHRAVAAAAALPALQGCSDVEALARAVPPGAPADREGRRALRSTLRRVEALTWTGRYDTALQEAIALERDARALGDPGLLARAGLALSMIQQNLGDDVAAEKSASAAAQNAAEAADDATMAEAWLRVLFVIAAAPERADEFRALVEVAEAAVVRAGNGPLLRARLESARTRMLAVQGKLEEASTLSRALVTQVEETLGVDHPEFPDYISNAGLDLHASGKRDEARALFERAVELDTAAFGESHPRLASDWHNLALVADTPDEAEQLFRRALKLRRDTAPPGAPEIADALANLGIVLHDGGKFDEAEAVLIEALEIHRKAHRGDHPNVAHALQFLGELLNDVGRRDRALQYAEEALAMRERILPEFHIDVARSHQLIGAIALNDGRPEDARPAYERSLEIRRKALRPDHPALAGPYYGLAKVLLASNDPEPAIDACRKALSLEEGAYGRDHPRVGVHLVCLTQALRQAKRPVEALEPAERVALLWTPGTVDPIRVGLAKFELALTLRAAERDAARATELAEQAKAILEQHPDAMGGPLKKLRAFLDPDGTAPSD